MKKILLGILVLGLLVGCGSKGGGLGGGNKLVCSYAESDGSDFVTTISHSGDKVTKVNMVSSMVIDDPSYVDMMAGLFESAMSAYDNIKGLDAKIVVSDAKDKISMVFDIDLDKLDYAALASLSGSADMLGGMDKDSRSLAKIRASLESEGYTCK